MIRARARFTAPLVLIVSCGQPPAPDEPWVERDPPPVEVAAVAPPDAAVPADAEVAVAVAPDAMVVPEYPVCGGRWEPGGPTCNPPSTTRAEIIDVSAAADGSVIVIALGSDDGVEKGWKGKLIDSGGKAITGGSFVISKVTARTSQAKVQLSRDELRDLRVRLAPP